MTSDQVSRWRQLHEANQNRAEEPAAKLDSSLKKNLAFIRKIKTFSAESSASILKDAESLALDKYLSEVNKSLAEGVLRSSKTDDVVAAAELASVLHRRFGPSFTPFFNSYLINAAFAMDDAKPATAQKAAIKLLVELALASVCLRLGDCDVSILSEQARSRLKGEKEGSLIVTKVLAATLSHGVDRGYALSLAVALAKRYAVLWESELTFPFPGLVSQFQASLVDFCRRSLDAYRHIQEAVAVLEEKGKKASIRTGKILDEYSQPLEELQERNSVFETNLQSLIGLLGVDANLADYRVEKSDEKAEISFAENTKVWWEDAKERDFYKEVPSYKTLLSSPLPPLIEAQYANLAEGEKVNLFVSHLESMTLEEDVQNATVEMHRYIPYNKATKNRLSRFFVESKKTDVVDLYARFLSINSEFLPDLILDVIEVLDRGFRSQIYRGTIDFTNIAFFGELVKFKLIPSHVVFHKIRKMTLHIAGTSNGDILSVFYDKCGKFLLFEPEYAETTGELLALLREQTKSDRLTVNEKASLTNLFLVVDSFLNPQGRKVVKTLLSDTQEYVHVVLRRFLANDSHKRALELLQGLDFSSEGDAQRALLDVFSKPEEMRHDTFESGAKLLVGLGKECKFLVIRVLDLLHEQMLRGLEINEYRLNSRRVAQMKMWAAFYNCGVVGFHTVMDCLFKIVCFGYPNNLPSPRGNSYDGPDNYFRIILVCTLLGAVDYKRVKAEGLLVGGVKTVEGFLHLLNYYAFCKAQPLPRDVDFSVSSVLERVKEGLSFSRSRNMAEAVGSFQTYALAHSKSERSKEESIEVGESEGGAEHDELDDSTSESDSESDPEETSEESSSEEELSDGVTDDELEEFSELAIYQQELGRQRLQQSKISKFDLQIKELLAEAETSAKHNVALKIPAPPSVTEDAPASDSVQFNFLSKNRVKEFALPSDNKFTERIAMERVTQKANRDKIMSLVNNMDS